MASMSFGVGVLWCITLATVLRSNKGSPTPVIPFPKKCDIVNKTYVDCSRCRLKAVPAYIPVTVETLDLSHNSIPRINSTSFQSLVNLVTLLLNHNSISRLKSIFFRNQGSLTNLILNHNQISKLPDDVFTYTPKIEVVDLSYMNQGLKQIPGAALRGLIKLRELNFRSNRLESANVGTNLSLPSLEVLNLGKNKITALRTGDFDALRMASLTSLNFTDNQIAVVESGVFDQLRSVDAIDFSQGLIQKAIPSLASALSGLSVQAIYLQQIGLKAWDGDNFKGLHNSSLKKLDLSSNNLTSLNSSFSGLANITELILMKNTIAEISETAFSGLQALEILDLSHNALASIKSVMFASLSSVPVTTLYLNGNKIGSLDVTGAFSGLSRLKYLKLSKNKISKTLIGDEFSGLKSLQVLDLGLNTNMSLSSDAFRHVPSLQTLYLNLLHLKNITVKPSPFQSLHSLKKLDLSNNNMAALDPGVFSNLQELDTLYLQHNNLYKMWNVTTHVRFLKSLHKLRYVDLCFNGFQNIPNNTFEDQHQLESLRLCHNKISHLENGVFKGVVVRALDLAYNQINLINRTIMEPILGSLETLSLSRNPFSCGCDLQWFRDWLDTTTVRVDDLDHCTCASPPSMRGKRLMKFHPEVLNCEHRLPLYAWILVGVGSASIIMISGLVFRFKWYLQYYYYLINAKRKNYERLAGDDKPFQYDAFVSFCQKDKQWIEGELLPHLEGDVDFKLCIHDRDFILGKNINDNIVQAMDSSRYTLCLVSTDFLDSHWCKLEREYAMANIIHRDVLIIIKYGDIPKEKLTRYYKLHKAMMKRTYLMWPMHPGKERDVFWQKLIAVLRNPDMRVNNNA